MLEIGAGNPAGRIVTAGDVAGAVCFLCGPDAEMIRGQTLIVNLPGSTGGVKDGLAVLEDLVNHAVALVRGDPVDH